MKEDKQKELLLTEKTLVECFWGLSYQGISY